jgi:penicillin-binding protein activator
MTLSTTRYRSSTLFFLSALLLAVGCGGTQVKRMDVDEVKDLSGRWNDTDSRLVAQEMMTDCLSRPWIAKATKGSKAPTVIVGSVRNQSHEHIATDTFVEDLQRELINSGKVEFVASKGERGDVRDERLDQDSNADEETRKAHGKETGADFMLSGVISTIQDKEGGKEVVLYQTNLKLLNMQSNQIVWNGQKKIKKFISRARASW